MTVVWLCVLAAAVALLWAGRPRRGRWQVTSTDPVTAAMLTVIIAVQRELDRLGHQVTWAKGPDPDTLLGECAACAGTISLGFTPAGRMAAGAGQRLARGGKLLRCRGSGAR